MPRTIRTTCLSPRIEQVRVPLEQLVGIVEAQPSTDKLKTPALLALNALTAPLGLSESVRHNYSRALKQQRRGILAVSEAAASEHVRGQNYHNAQDEALGKRAFARKLEEKASKKLRNQLGAALAPQADSAAARLVKAAESYVLALKKEKVRSQMPISDLSAEEVAKLSFESKQFALWEPERFLSWVEDAVDLFTEKELSRLRLQIVDFIHSFTQKSSYLRAQQKPRPSAVRADDVAIRQLRRVSEGLVRASTPDWLAFHEEQVLPVFERIFRVTCGIDARQLSKTEFSRVYLSNREIKPFTLSENWHSRFCDEINVVAAGRSFELDTTSTPPTKPAPNARKVAVTKGATRASRADSAQERKEATRAKRATLV